MTKNNFKDNMEKLNIFYPNWSVKTEDSLVMKSWYDMLKDFSDEEFIEVVSNHIRNEKFNPTICSLMNQKSTKVFDRSKIKKVRT